MNIDVSDMLTGQYPRGCHLHTLCSENLKSDWTYKAHDVVHWRGIYEYDHMRSRVSPVSIVSGYGLDDREIEVRSPAEAKDFSSNLCVQTGSGAHPASCTMGTGGLFPGAKARPRSDADHSPPSSAEVVNE
jgi:hypothetical protein